MSGNLVGFCVTAIEIGILCCRHPRCVRRNCEDVYLVFNHVTSPGHGHVGKVQIAYVLAEMI